MELVYFERCAVDACFVPDSKHGPIILRMDLDEIINTTHWK